MCMENTSRLIKNYLHINCLHDGFFMYTDKVIIQKWEFIPPIPDYMIPVDFCENNPPVIDLTIDKMRYKYEVFTKNQNGCTIFNWNHTNRMAANTRRIMGWRKYTLLRWFWFLDTVSVSILIWIAFRRGYWECLSNK